MLTRCKKCYVALPLETCLRYASMPGRFTRPCCDEPEAEVWEPKTASDFPLLVMTENETKHLNNVLKLAESFRRERPVGDTVEFEKWETAEKVVDNLHQDLGRLERWGRNGGMRCWLGTDGGVFGESQYAPPSFSFSIYRTDDMRTSEELEKAREPYAHLVPKDWRFVFNGGLIFHGRHDGFGSGSGPTFAVTLTPTQGWSIHT